MIGEVVKLGFDGGAVSKGLKKITGGFGKLKRGMKSATKQVGIGIGRQAGVTIFGTVLKGLTAIPAELGNLARLNKEMEVMGITTGTTSKQFLAMRAAMSKATGKGTEDAADDLKDFAERIAEARADYKSSANQGLIRMGVRVTDMDGMTLENQLRTIGGAVKAFETKHGKGKSIFPLREAFGDQSANWLPLLLNFDSSMDSAYKSTSLLVDLMKELGTDLQGINDLKQAFGMKMSELSLGVLVGMKVGGFDSAGIASFMDSLFAGADAKGIGGKIAEQMKLIKSDGIWSWVSSKMGEIASAIGGFLMEQLEKLWTWLMEKIPELLGKITTAIADGIKAGIKTALADSGTMWEMLKSGVMGGKGKLDENGNMKTTKNSNSGSGDGIIKMIADNTLRNNTLTERLLDQSTTPVYT